MLKRIFKTYVYLVFMLAIVIACLDSIGNDTLRYTQYLSIAGILAIGYLIMLFICTRENYLIILLTIFILYICLGLTLDIKNNIIFTSYAFVFILGLVEVCIALMQSWRYEEYIKEEMREKVEKVKSLGVTLEDLLKFWKNEGHKECPHLTPEDIIYFWETEVHKKEKSSKNSDKIEFEEISPDGKITRTGKIEKIKK